MYLWKLISVPFNEKHSINAGQINDLELKNQLDLLKIQGWEVVLECLLLRAMMVHSLIF